MKAGLGILVLTLILFSCGKNDRLPTGVLNIDKMKVVFWDILKADAMTKEYGNANVKNGIYDSLKNYRKFAILEKEIFAIHHISKEDYYNSLDYYKKNTVLMKILMDSIINKANKERNKLPYIKEISPAQL